MRIRNTSAVGGGRHARCCYDRDHNHDRCDDDEEERQQQDYDG